MKRMRLRAGGWLVVSVLAAGCSVAANLSADDLLREVDAIVKIDVANREVRYADRAEVSLYYTRAPLLLPLYPLFYVLYGRTGEYELENPAAHVRELLLELPDETGTDLERIAKAAIRFGWIAQLDRNAHNRLVSVGGLARLAEAISLPLFAGDYRAFGVPADPQSLVAARASVDTRRPGARAANLDVAALLPYAEAVRQLATSPLDSAFARLQLLEEVATLYVEEPLPAIREALAPALQDTLRHVVEGLLAQIVQDRSPDLVELRLCAMQTIRRFGGPRAVPLLLALMVSSPAQRARGEELFDPEWLVQLELIHYCGQLRGDLANATVQLPGRQGFEFVSPLDFLAITILNQDTYYSKLRVPALAALTWALQRPRLDPDVGWVRAWREQRR